MVFGRGILSPKKRINDHISTTADISANGSRKMVTVLAYPNSKRAQQLQKLTLNTEGILVGGSGTSLGTMVT
jgi:hypothetical protein